MQHLPRPAPAVLLLALLLGAPDARGETYEVEGGAIRVELVPDWTAAMVGEPLYLSLVVENVTSRDLFYRDGSTRNRLGRPDFLEVTTVRSDGLRAEVPDAGPSFGALYGRFRLRPGERRAKRLFLPSWAVITEPGTYTVTCRRAYDLFDGTGDDTAQWPPAQSVAVSVRTTITIDPADPAKVPAMLGRWEPYLRGPDTDAAEEAARALALVTDPRAVPLLETGVASGYYGIMERCLGALAKFEGDLALAGIEMGLDAKAADLKAVSNDEAALSLAANLHHAAALALSRSRNPRALGILRGLADHPESAVRLTVVQTFGGRGFAEDVELLRRFVEDGDERVRGEAKRYLEKLAAKPPSRD